jgi:TetR/AcrR family transcriptional regulator, transcriptional repressor for nem operon
MSDSKEHIIMVACKLFLQKSYKEVTMKEIVEKTGLSKGAFYHYFESKEQLFLEVLDFFFTCVMTHAYETYSRESFYKFYHDYANEVKGFVKEYIFKFKAEDESDEVFSMNYFTLAFDALKLFPEFRGKMIAGQEKELKIWTDVIDDARKKGEIKSSMTNEEIAKLFIYVGDGLAMHMVLKGAKMEEMVSPFLALWDRLYDQMKV